MVMITLPPNTLKIKKKKILSLYLSHNQHYGRIPQIAIGDILETIACSCILSLIVILNHIN